MPWWYTLIGVVVGGLITAVATLLNTFVSSRQQNQRDSVVHDRQLELNSLDHNHQLERDAREHAPVVRDAKRAALRAAYIEVDVAAQALQDVVHSLRFLLKGQSEPERNKMLNEHLGDAIKNLSRTMAALRLESDAPDIPQLYTEVWSAYISCTTHLAMNREQQELGGQIQPLDVGEAEEALQAAVNRIREEMQKHLEGLGNPS